MEIKARVTQAGVRNGAAISRIEIEGASPQEVRDMFLQEAPGAFFPGASSYFRQTTASGGQTCWENPVGGPPLMHTRIEPTARGVEGNFQGLVKGCAPLTIFSEGGKTIVMETGTIARPNLGLNPFSLVAESIPVFGLFPRLLREATESVLGVGLAAIHAAKVENDDAQAIAQTLQRRREQVG